MSDRKTVPTTYKEENVRLRAEIKRLRAENDRLAGSLTERDRESKRTAFLGAAKMIEPESPNSAARLRRAAGGGGG